VKVVRIHDPNRRPASWTAMIEPGQFVAFSRDIDSGAPCGGDGRGFADHAEATCVILDALAEAEAFCAAAVEAAPSVRFDVFDAEGRAKPALMTVVHPSRAKTLDTNPRAQRRRRAIAWILIATGIPLIAYAYWMHREQDIILPAFVGINMIIAGGRLLWFNLGLRETEREREARLAGLRDK
jgi:hypothetical protein